MLVSRFVKIPLLLDASEMEALFAHLPPFLIYEVGRVVAHASLSQAAFLERYAAYVASLKRGEKSCWESSYLFTVNSAIIEVKGVGERFLVKPRMPVIQLQPSRVRYSAADGAFQTGVYGEGCISWGVQLAYPFLFQDEKTHAIEKIKQSARFPNTELFLKVQRWVRHHTRATPFLVEGKRINVPVRLGKGCFAWIQHHPDLQEVAVAC